MTSIPFRASPAPAEHRTMTTEAAREAIEAAAKRLTSAILLHCPEGRSEIAAALVEVHKGWEHALEAIDALPVRAPRGETGARIYEKVEPVANYKPWNRDPAFTAVYEAIRGHTLVDRFRCYELWTLVEQSAKLAAGDLLEVGVWRGGTGVVIAEAARRAFLKDTVYLADTFRGIVKAGPRDNHWQNGDHRERMCETNRAMVGDLLAFRGLENVVVGEGIFPDDFRWLRARPWRFVHIDVDVYQSAREVSEWIWPQLVAGGIVVFDDYGFEECQGVRDYVDEQRGFDDRLVLYNLNGHAVVVKSW